MASEKRLIYADALLLDNEKYFCEPCNDFCSCGERKDNERKHE